MSFETDLARLEEITGRLRDEKTGLEEAIKLYEEAAALEKKLSATLGDVERKIDIVTSKADAECVETKPVTTDSEEPF